MTDLTINSLIETKKEIVEQVEAGQLSVTEAVVLLKKRTGSWKPSYAPRLVVNLWRRCAACYWKPISCTKGNHGNTGPNGWADGGLSSSAVFPAG